jgi:hypothetical protein
MGKLSTQIFKRPSHRRAVVLMLALTVLGVSGCGKRGPTIAPVSGQVLLDGKPVEGAAVGFIPKAGGPMADGTTDAEGRFQLLTMNRPGATVGKHAVTVTKVKHSGINPDGSIAPGGVATTWLVPQKYSKPTTSNLTAVVEQDGLECVFELSSK